MTEIPVLDEESLQQLYTWIDEIPLTRPKKNISRDFSDGVMIAEIIHHFLPKMVDLHNYSPACSTNTKLDNWNLLSRKCFTKLSYNIDENLVKGAVACKPGVIEFILQELRQHIEAYVACKNAATLVDKQKYYDELNPDSYNYEVVVGNLYQTQNGYTDGSVYAYSEGNQPLPQQQQQQQQLPHQGHVDANNNILHPQYQYHYQNQPQPIMNDRSNMNILPAESENLKNNAEQPAPNKARKPVTHANKIKTKQSQMPLHKIPAPGTETYALRMALEEKEQSLLASQETVQILQAKIRRLEHLLHLKDLRINELKNQPMPTMPVANIQLSQKPHINQSHHLPPNQNISMHSSSHGFTNTRFPHPTQPPLPQIAAARPDESSKYQM